MPKKVRVRFAPSPTGPLHIGGVRTALFNYLFAKKHQGDFILRIEDTDQKRYVPSAEQYIIESLQWLGIIFDESPKNKGNYGPYRQSERKEIYKDYALQLIEKGKAYYSFDTPEELDTLRTSYQENKKTFIYNWHNRERLNNSLTLSPEQTQSKINAGEPYVIRFKSPANTSLLLHDEIRGKIKIDAATLDDKVLFKSDGMPTYHLANIVDDHLMDITHVIRGEEWLPSLALHTMLYDAFGWETPKFAHLSLILKPNGKGKLSKRDGQKGGFPVFPLQWNPKEGESFSGYKEQGYLPEAVTNMLAFLGWNPGLEEELFTLNELTQLFSLERANKAGAKFDPEKAKWFQQQYFQKRNHENLVHEFSSLLKTKGVTTSLDLSAIVTLIKERVSFLEELWEQASFFFKTPKEYDKKASKKAFKEDTDQILKNVIEQLESVNDFSSDKTSNITKAWATSQNIGLGKIMMPLRLSLVGAMKGPDVFNIMEILGEKETINRITKAIAHFY